MISTQDELQAKKLWLETLPEDWYVDMDGSYADRPNQWTIDQAIATAEWAIDRDIIVEGIDVDANGGTCVDLRNEDYREISIYFRNSEKTVAISRGRGGWSEPTTVATWSKIESWLKGD